LISALSLSVHPVAFQFGAFTITWYGIMVVSGFLAGLWTANRRAPLAGLHAEAIQDFGPWLLVGAILGARALYVLTFWREQFADSPFLEWFAVWRGGLVYYGGLIGAALVTIFYARRKRLGLWRLSDVLAPSIALGSAFGRIGCLMNGCCYGRASSLPWAIHFPENHQTYPHGVHPTQIYDAILSLGFYAFLAWLYRRKKFDGQVFTAYLGGYAVLRFAVEFTRGDYPPNQHYLGGWATPAQVVSLLMFLAALAFWRFVPRPAPSTKSGPSVADETVEPARKGR
jgi:phosphatidylglycerol:prolipoprotein diacylglycerol transferase